MKNSRLTIDQAVEWLFDNTKLWNAGGKVINSSAVCNMRARYKSGELKELAKTNLIEKSGVFVQTKYFEFK